MPREGGVSTEAEKESNTAAERGGCRQWRCKTLFKGVRIVGKIAFLI